MYPTTPAAASARAEDSRGAYLSRLEAFDPRAYLADTAKSLFGGIAEDYGRTEGMRRASLNRRGLLRSDIGGGAATRDLNERIARAVAGLGGQAAQLEQGRIEGFGSVYGQDLSNATSERELALAREQYNTDRGDERRRTLGSGIGALLGGVAGSIVPGIGTAAGAGAGSAIGGGLSRLFG